MQRFMLCPIIGTGTGGPLDDPFRASVQDLDGVQSVSLIPTDETGHPLYHFALCRVSVVNWVPVLQVSNSYVFPDYALDSQMSGMESGARNGLVSDVQAFDLDGDGLHLDAGHNSTDSYRHLLNAIGRQIDAAFDVDHFGVAEVPPQ